MGNKIPELNYFIEQEKSKIIFVTETWFNEKNTFISDLTFQNQFTPILANRENKKGGGCAIFLRNEIPFQIMFMGTQFNCEIIHLKIMIDEKPIHLCCVYRPPLSTTGQTKKLFKFLEEIPGRKKLICGDFNLPNIKWTTLNDIAMADFLHKTETSQHVLEHTCNNSILDLIFTHPKELVDNVKVNELFSTSDHRIINFTLNEKSPKITVKKGHKRDLNAKNFLKLSVFLAKINFSDLLSTSFDITNKYDTFTKQLFELFNTFVPLKPISKIIKNSLPSKIHRLNQQKLILHRRLKSTLNEVSLKTSIKIVSRQIRIEHQKHVDKKESNLISKGRIALYKYVKNKIQPNTSIPTLIDKNGKIYTKENEKCELFAKTFQKSFMPNNFTDILIEDLSFDEKLEDIDFDLLTVFNMLKRVPNKNSNSPDGIPYILIKKCADQLAPIVTELFRIILDEGNIPPIWKTSFIVPIFKKGDPSSPGNYRPISLTCTFCRIFERILVKKMVEFLNRINFFNKEQFGFLKKRSTTTQLLTMLEDFYNAIQRGENIDVIYIDFAKAFDTVPIDLLLKKLKNIGFEGKIFQFLKNFLTDRSFRVKIGDTFSDPYQTFSGVPQGSVLGPILFLIFINDLPNCLHDGIGFKIYADDLKIYVTYKDETRKELLKTALHKIEKWSNDNGLKISSEKSMALYIGKQNQNTPYSLCEEIIPREECVKDLGILIDSELSFSQHINKVIKSSYLAANQILKIMKTRDLKTLIFAYKTYVRPLLEYATETWNPHKKSDINRIEKIQKFYTRRAFKKCGLVPLPYEKRLDICGIQKLTKRRKIADLVMTQKILTGQTHLPPQKYFSKTVRAHRKPLLLQNRKCTSKTQRNFFIRIVSLWNKLPKQAMEFFDSKDFRKLTTELDLSGLVG